MKALVVVVKTCLAVLNQKFALMASGSRVKKSQRQKVDACFLKRPGRKISLLKMHISDYNGIMNNIKMREVV